MATVDLKTFLFDGTTNDTGSFSIPHVLEDFNPDGHRIAGIIASVQHTDGRWHTLASSNAVDNHFSWNKNAFEGTIASPEFFKRPVKVLVFAEFIVG